MAGQGCEDICHNMRGGWPRQMAKGILPLGVQIPRDSGPLTRMIRYQGPAAAEPLWEGSPDPDGDAVAEACDRTRWVDGPSDGEP